MQRSDQKYHCQRRAAGDQSWVELMQIARAMGLSVEEVRKFIKESSRESGH